jgi:mono/diheme cytochrome c family protein
MPVGIQLFLLLLLLAACRRPAPSVAVGRSLYAANGCGSCHGESGDGDGPAASRLAVKPADFRHPDLFRNGASESAIAETLAEGVLDKPASDPHFKHRHHELVMPKFDHLTEFERRSIALYVISMSKNRD